MAGEIRPEDPKPKEGTGLGFGSEVGWGRVGLRYGSVWVIWDPDIDYGMVWLHCSRIGSGRVGLKVTK